MQLKSLKSFQTAELIKHMKSSRFLNANVVKLVNRLKIQAVALKIFSRIFGESYYRSVRPVKGKEARLSRHQPGYNYVCLRAFFTVAKVFLPYRVSYHMRFLLLEESKANDSKDQERIENEIHCRPK